MSICCDNAEVELAFEERLAIWKAKLNNGLTCYQNDYKGCTWKKLKEYCDENGLYVANISLIFRSNTLDIEQADGYSIVNAIGCWLGEESQRQISVGRLLNDKVEVFYYNSPDLSLSHTATRTPEHYKETLIQGCTSQNIVQKKTI